jgi:uncharacterized membrane protein (UPF0127 family)
MRIILAVILILVLSVIPSYSESLPNTLPNRLKEIPKTDQIRINNEWIEVDIAETDQERAQGLMNRESLEDDHGMLFIFPSPDRYAFWMKNMRIPIDIIWIDKDKRVVDIKSRVPPCGEVCESMVPAKEALYVLELASGSVEDRHIKIGDVISINWPHPIYP